MTAQRRHELKLYEELVLLALHDRKGTFTTGFAAHLIAGAVLAELSLTRRIALDGKKQLVELRGTPRSGDPIVDECIAKIASAKRRAPLKTWVSRLASIKKLPQKSAQRLAERGVLRAEERTVLLMFTRKVFPEIDPAYEREIVERMRGAIFTDAVPVDPRTGVLVALAAGGDLLKQVFERRELRARKPRIRAIASGDVVGEATREAIAAYQAAIMMAAIMPAMVAGAS